MTTSSHNHLPLEKLMIQLQVAGFEVGPREWQKLELALRHHVELLLSEQGLLDLEFVLAPILCKNPQEQEQFHQLYQGFLRQIKVGGVKQVDLNEKVKAAEKKASWLPILIIAGILALFFIGLNWYVKSFSQYQNQDKFKFEVQGIDFYRVGDTLQLINNTTAEDAAGLNFHWYLLNVKDSVLWDTLAFDHPYFVVPTPHDEDYFRSIRVIVEKQNGGQYYGNTGEILFQILCANPPTSTQNIGASGAFNPDSIIEFRSFAIGNSYSFEWDFGDGAKSSEENPSHRYNAAGTYNVKLLIRDTSNQVGLCELSKSRMIRIEEEEQQAIASLPGFDLLKDETPNAYSYGWGVLLILMSLLTATMGLWRRWYNSRKKFEADQAALKEAKKEQLQIVDQAPYSIPFQNKEQEIKTETITFDLAKQLRSREEGERLLLNIPKTVQQTVEEGGFLKLQFQPNTKPSDYLFLIDRKSADSHQARLFEYLTKLLAAQDVFVDYWTYEESFDRFWNPAQAEAIGLEALYKNYADRRLIIFGDGEALLDADLGPSEVWLEILSSWKQRLLITPKALKAWASGERRLYQFFPIYPAHLESIYEAVSFMDEGWSWEELPNDYEEWKLQLIRKQPNDPSDRQRFRKWEDYKKYLQQHPELYTWLKALVVYPELHWNLTIAIGKALDAPVNYDNLLILSRIPDFEEGAFPERIWRSIWPQLDLEAEEKARLAVKEELAAVEAKVAQGFAANQWRTEKLIQDFALAPNDAQLKENIQLLLEADQFDAMQLEELDLVVQRNTPTKASDADPPGAVLNSFLSESEAKAPLPIFNRPFWWAAALSVLTFAFLIGLLVSNATFWGQQYGAKAFLIEPEFTEAQLLNNEAVDLYNQIKPTLTAEYLNDPNTIFLNNPSFIKILDALDSDVDYAYAYENRNRLLYSFGKISFETASTQFSLGIDSFYTAKQLGLAEDEDLWKSPIYNSFHSALRYFAPVVGSDETSGGLWIGEFYPNQDEVLPFGINFENITPKDSIGFYAAHGIASAAYYMEQDTLACKIYDSLQVHFSEQVSRGGLEMPYLEVCTEDIIPQAPALIIDPTPRQTNNEAIAATQNTLLSTLRIDNTVELGLFEDANNSTNASATYYGGLIIDQKGDRLIVVTHEGFEEKLLNADRFRLINSNKRMDPVALGANRDPVQIFGKDETLGLIYLSLPNSIDFALGADFFSDPILEQINFRLRSNPFYILDLENGSLKSTLVDSLLFKPHRFILDKRVLNERPISGQPIYSDKGVAGIIYEIINQSVLGYSIGEIILSYMNVERAIPQPKMIFVKGGTFTMGCTKAQEATGNCLDSEKPAHQVQLSDFYIAETEVSFAQYDAFCEATNREKPRNEGWGRDQRPVINVSWFDAIEYCNWLSKVNGLDTVYSINLSDPENWEVTPRKDVKGYRLPTEAEWEYAARGGPAHKEDLIYSGSNDIDSVGWYEANSKRQTQPVKGLKANQLGLYDMSGNVWEWCWDWYDEEYYNSLNGTANNPLGAENGESRVVRGGSWYYLNFNCRVSGRYHYDDYYRSLYVGFRVARY